MGNTHKPVNAAAAIAATSATSNPVAVATAFGWTCKALTLAQARERYPAPDGEQVKRNTVTPDGACKAWEFAKFVPTRADGSAVVFTGANHKEAATCNVYVSKMSPDSQYAGKYHVWARYRPFEKGQTTQYSGAYFTNPTEAGERMRKEALMILSGRTGKPGTLPAFVAAHTWQPRPGAGRRRQSVVTELDSAAIADFDAPAETSTDIAVRD